MKKDLISIKYLSLKEIEDIFKLTSALKKEPHKFSQSLKGKSLALIFEKPSNRTYVSFQVGMFELGGNSIYLGPEHIKLGVRETVCDVAKTLSRYCHAIVLRTFAHERVLEMAGSAPVPVINGLSDLTHPCQGLADIYTVYELRGKIKGLTLAYVGDGNNVCHSLLFGCAKVGMNVHVATPVKYGPDAEVLKDASLIAGTTGAKIRLFHDPKQAVKSVDVIYTDVWASMGQEQEAEKRKKIFKAFQVNNDLLKLAKKDVLIMHCLPAHRGEEITSSVIDSKNSVVFQEAENRLHVQKAILIKLSGDKR